ncbi:MAG: hypothetical protein ABR582_10300 [Gemmatimonadaceae bacterium]
MEAFEIRARMVYAMSDFKNVKAWQKAHKMALATHHVACKIAGQVERACGRR